MVSKKGKFEAKFTIPDVYGVYQFKVSFFNLSFFTVY